MKHYFPFFCLVILLFPACVRSPQLEGYGQARGFTLEKNSEGEVTAARILYDGQIFEYEFCRREEGRSGFVDGSFRRFRVAVPQIRTAVCTSTMLVLLDEIGAVGAVAGMDGDYTTVPSFRKRIEEGKISFLADGMVLDKEKLAALKPETVFFSPASGDRSEIQKIIDCGAVPVPIQDWREPDPLGRARWAELEAAFFGKSEEAALLFRETEQRYRKIAEEVSLRSSRPQVIFHLPVNGQWRMPSGNSFTAAAVRDGGGDPSTNGKLRDVIAKAKANNMPNENIKRSIAKAAGELGNVNYEEITYEGYAPGGMAVIVSTVTDNRNRTASDVRHIFDKNGGSLGTNGCVSYMFDNVGMLVIERKPGMDEDEVMMAALDAGASDINALEDSFEVTTTVSDFSSVRENLENAGYTFLSAELTMVPQTTNPITDPDTVAKIQKMLEMLDDLDDVQDVYHNGELPEEEEEDD